MQTRRCKQCGEVKALNKDNFRPYYGDNAQGHYKICKVCESINNRYKYLTGKSSLTDIEQEEVNKIEALYETLKEMGYNPPKYGSRDASTTMDVVDAMYERIMNKIQEKKVMAEEAQVEVDTGTPAELLQWLSEPLNKDPEYYEEVYFSLREKYVPVVGIDKNGAVYNTTHKEILDKILERFDEYEDNYYKD